MINLGKIYINQQKIDTIAFQNGAALFYTSKIIEAMQLFLQNYILQNPEFCKKMSNNFR